MNQYNLYDQVWIHIGEPRLVQGRVIDIIDFSHIEGYDDTEHYIIEITTGIDNIFEVRSWEQISSTAEGPINAYKDATAFTAARYLGKVGIKMPYIPAPAPEPSKKRTYSKRRRPSPKS